MDTCTDWIYENVPATEINPLCCGFVYCIENLIDGRQYIGKKKVFFQKTSQKTVTLKSGIKKKKKIRSQVESDWREYYGSSDELKADVQKLGVQNFRRTILKYCFSLSELTYCEAAEQFSREVLLHPDRFYNKWIMCRIRSDHLNKKKI